MEKAKLRILYIDDDPGDIEILNRHLMELQDYDIDFDACSGMDEDCKSKRFTGIDLFFVDYLLGPITGLDMLKIIRGYYPHTPVIMITGQGDEKIAVAAMKAGLSDYIVKSDLSSDSLAKAITNVLKQFNLEEKVRQQQVELVQMATQDSLTKLLNRRSFFERLETEIDRAKRYKLSLCCLMIDIDHFKKVNDTYGHLVGDSVLAMFADILKEVGRNTDIVGRFGGEEFIVGVTNTDLNGAKELAERIREKVVENKMDIDEHQRLQITCSIGVSEMMISDKAGDIINRADQSLYVAKKEGRNKVKVM